MGDGVNNLPAESLAGSEQAGSRTRESRPPDRESDVHPATKPHHYVYTHAYRERMHMLPVTVIFIRHKAPRYVDRQDRYIHGLTENDGHEIGGQDIYRLKIDYITMQYAILFKTTAEYKSQQRSKLYRPPVIVE